MLRDRYARRRLFTFMVLVVLSVGMIAVSDTGPVDELRNGVRFAITPVQDSLGEGTRSVTSVIDAIGEVDTLRRDNEQLSEEVQRLGDQLAVMESMREENKRLTKLLGTQRSFTGDGIEVLAAGVTSRQFTQFERLVTLDRGIEADVREDAPVFSEGGALLGRVIAAGEGWADVMLISDPNSLVAGWVSRTEATGEVIGRLSAPLSMTDIPRTERLRVDDRVVTYGINLGGGFRSVYPKGIPIGRVVDIIDNPAQVVKTALIVPEADLQNVEYVLVQANFRAPLRNRASEDAGG